jgi:SRSO17 transposase
MTYEMGSSGFERIERYFGQIGRHLPDKRQRASFATYAFGLLGSAERKSVEPIAALACPDPVGCKRLQNRLLSFLGVGRWQDMPVRLEAARYAVQELSAQDLVRVWVIDDTGFLKQGKESVGVQRQYTGSAGKTANCQIGVSLSIATAGEHVPIDFELYLPRTWMDDPARRAVARIPRDLVFKTKIELALDMIDRAAAANIPGDVVLADSAYGESVEFRGSVRLLGFDFGVGIHGPTKVYLVDSESQTIGKPIGAQQLGVMLGPKAFRKYTWREATNGKKLWSRFCFRRVKVAADDGAVLDEREVLWLMIEWPEGEPKPTKFVLTTMPRRMSKKRIARIVKERWRTERVYEEMKGELGLDHFEGRSYPGWHHHVTVAICCYAFIVAERARSFPPSAERKGPPASDRVAA